TIIRVVHITTVPSTLGFLKGQAAYMRSRGIELTFVSSEGDGALRRISNDEGVDHHAVPFVRHLAPKTDIASIRAVDELVGRLKPDIVHAHTPKAGLAGMLAATRHRTPLRMFHFRGSPALGRPSAKQRAYAMGERVTCRLADIVVAIGPTLLQEVVGRGICSIGKIRTLPGGMGNGIDIHGRFNPEKFGNEERERLRSSLGIPPDAPVVLYVGRLSSEKGVDVLWEAWTDLRTRVPEARLLVVGSADARNPAEKHFLDAMATDSRVVMPGWVADPRPFYAISTVLSLPSRREGLANTPLEAAAMRLPAVVSPSPGCADTVWPGVTGEIAANPRELADALARYLTEPARTNSHGAAARAWVGERCDPTKIWSDLANLYLEGLAESSRVR
ncbi:MAG: glycosyltransferase, partial [Myxococcales bacterium]|nr:glycosyltransferase [Myxococcales bacterium]